MISFERKKAIYLQIADYVCEQILLNHWKAEDKVPSVRELAINIAVNPNTIQRTYSYLEEQGIISMQRGIGYFVAKEAFEVVVSFKRREFLSQELPQMFKSMKLLKINLDEIVEQYNRGRNEN